MPPSVTGSTVTSPTRRAVLMEPSLPMPGVVEVGPSAEVGEQGRQVADLPGAEQVVVGPLHGDLVAGRGEPLVVFGVDVEQRPGHAAAGHMDDRDVERVEYGAGPVVDQFGGDRLPGQHPPAGADHVVQPGADAAAVDPALDEQLAGVGRTGGQRARDEVALEGV